MPTGMSLGWLVKLLGVVGLGFLFLFPALGGSAEIDKRISDKRLTRISVETRELFILKEMCSFCLGSALGV